MSSAKASGFTPKLSEKIVSLRAPILLLFVGLLIVFGYFASRFTINASADTLLTKNNELYIKTQLANQKFSPSEFILIAYQPKDSRVFSEQTFKNVEYLAKELGKLERVETVNSILSIPLIENQSQLLSAGGVADLTYEKQGYSLKKMETLLKDHPIYTDLILNKKADTTSLQLVFTENKNLVELNNNIIDIQKNLLDGDLSKAQNNELTALKKKAGLLEAEIGKVRQQEVKQIEAVIRTIETDANVYIGGSYVVGIRLVEIVKQDLVYFGLAITALISVLLLVLFRTLRWLVFPVFACASSVAITLGILAVLEIPATIISANFVALQLILTLAIMLHLITCYREISRDNTDFSQRERITATLTEKLRPCFFAAITTSVGFGSLILSGIQPIMDFGIMMLISNAVTLIVALFVFPALLSVLSAQPESNEYQWVTKALSSLKNVVVSRTKTVMLVPLLILIAISFGITKLNVENSFIDYFHKDTQIYKELSFIDKEFGGSTPLDIIINLDDVEKNQDLTLRANEVNALHLAHATVNAFEASGNVTSLINFTTLAKQLNDNKPLTEYELDIIFSLIDKKVIDQLIGAYVDVETNTLRISTRIQDTLPGLNRAQMLENLRNDLQAAGLSENEFEFTSLFVLYQDILSRLFDSQIKTLGFVYLALGLILLVVFRSIKLALIALVPNVVTTTGILGLIGWLGIPLDLMTITIAAIAMGIAIDDTIHFIDAYISGESGNKLASSFSHTGLAITYTSTLIAAGFGMFVFSDFMPSVYFGLLTACAMLFALLTDITVLPAMLKTFIGDSQVSEESLKPS